MLRVLPPTKKKTLQPYICFKTGSNIGGKTRNIAIQLVLKQCFKTSCTFSVFVFTVA